MDEPWLRGPIAGVHPLLAPVLCSFQHAREDLARYTEPLTNAQIWAKPFDLGSVGFHVLHIAGSVDRLLTYAQGRQLSPEQMQALRDESTPAPIPREQLLAKMDQTFLVAERVIRTIDPATLADVRTVGRKQLPTTVIGLLIHIAEHTQRHIGQAISAAKLAARCGIG